MVVVRPDWTAGTGARCGRKADTAVTEAPSVQLGLQGLRAVSFHEFLTLLLSPFEGVRLSSIAVQKIEELGSVT